MEGLTVDEVAKRLKLHIRTVYRLLESGELPGTRLGRLWRVPASALNGLAGLSTPRLDLEIRARISEAIDALTAQVLKDDFRMFFTEADVAAAHAAELKALLSPQEYEVHLELGVAGADPRERPDVSVLPRLESWTERRGSLALYSMEVKYFSYRGAAGGFQLEDGQFRELLASVKTQFDRLTKRREAGLLGAGSLFWVDAFDWLQRLRRADDAERRAVVTQRGEWVRAHLSQPASQIRVEYLPVLYPDLRVSLPNDFLGTGNSAERSGQRSLRGAARPFIRRPAPTPEEWDELVAEAVLEEFQKGEAMK